MAIFYHFWLGADVRGPVPGGAIRRREIATVATAWEQVPRILSPHQDGPAVGKQNQPAEDPKSLYFRHIKDYCTEHREGGASLYAANIPTPGGTVIRLRAEAHPLIS